jgi:hypothetical protein
MTNIELTSAELELIQAKRNEVEQAAATAKAKIEAERAKKVANAQTLLDRAAKIKKNEYHTLLNNFVTYKNKTTTSWKWNEEVKTIRERALIWNDETRAYEIIEELTAEVAEAVLTNGPLKIAYDSDKGFCSNISINRSSRWDPRPEPRISGYGLGAGYKSLSTAISKAEDLKQEMDRIERTKSTKQTLQQIALTQLQAEYPTAVVTPDTAWDKYSNSSRPVIVLQLANGIKMTLEPVTQNEDGVLQYLRSNITFPKIDSLDLIRELAAIAI